MFVDKNEIFIRKHLYIYIQDIALTREHYEMGFFYPPRVDVYYM